MKHQDAQTRDRPGARMVMSLPRMVMSLPASRFQRPPPRYVRHVRADFAPWSPANRCGQTRLARNRASELSPPAHHRWRDGFPPQRALRLTARWPMEELWVDTQRCQGAASGAWPGCRHSRPRDRQSSAHTLLAAVFNSAPAARLRRPQRCSSQVPHIGGATRQ